MSNPIRRPPRKPRKRGRFRHRHKSKRKTYVELPVVSSPKSGRSRRRNPRGAQGGIHLNPKFSRAGFRAFIALPLHELRRKQIHWFPHLQIQFLIFHLLLNRMRNNLRPHDVMSMETAMRFNWYSITTQLSHGPKGSAADLRVMPCQLHS